MHVEIWQAEIFSCHNWRHHAALQNDRPVLVPFPSHFHTSCQECWLVRRVWNSDRLCLVPKEGDFLYQSSTQTRANTLRWGKQNTVVCTSQTKLLAKQEVREILELTTVPASPGSRRSIGILKNSGRCKMAIHEEITVCQDGHLCVNLLKNTTYHLLQKKS